MSARKILRAVVYFALAAGCLALGLYSAQWAAELPAQTNWLLWVQALVFTLGGLGFIAVALREQD